MRLLRLLIALVALGAFALSGQACLLLGTHVHAVSDSCGDHHDGDEPDTDSRCQDCGSDWQATGSASLLPAPPVANLLPAEALAQMATGRPHELPTAEVDPPPDPLVRRAFVFLNRTAPARGPDVLA